MRASGYPGKPDVALQSTRLATAARVEIFRTYLEDC